MFEFDKNTFSFDKEKFREACIKDSEKDEQRRLHPINFDRIIGHEELKQEILLAVMDKCVKNEQCDQYLASIDYHATTGILLYGLPGVGKSEILRCMELSLIDHPDIDCKSMNCSEFQGNVGTNAKLIDAKFEEARNTQKKCCVLLIDEIDSIFMKKNGGLNVAERTNAMQANMDGMKDSSKIILIGTANRLKGMEDASLSRFTIITLQLPSLEERKQFIAMYIMPFCMNTGIDLDIMARDTEGFTGRNFRDVGVRLNRIRKITNKPLDKKDIIINLSKYMAYASKNIKRLEDYDI